MKHKIQISIIAFFCFLFSMNKVHAQTTMSITGAFDSLSTSCMVPADDWLYVYGIYSGYTNTDTFDVYFNFGDGSDTTIQCPVYQNGYYFYSYINHTYNFAGNYSVEYIVTTPDGISDTLVNYDQILLSDTCGPLSGKVYADANGNCVYDSGETLYAWVPVELFYNNNLSDITYTDQNGNYSFVVPLAQTYDIVLDTPSYNPYGFEVACPASASYTVTVPSAGNDFGIVCATTGFDLWGGFWTWGFIPGDTTYAYLYIGNNSCTAQNGVVKFVIDNPDVTFVSSVPAPDAIVGDTLEWNFTALNNSNTYYNYWNYSFVSYALFATSTNAMLGDPVCQHMIVEPVAGDNDPSNNYVDDCDAVVASFDPNEKEVSPRGVGASGSIAPNTELTYTIHFQNTGTAPAQNITVLDTLDSDLDLTTLHMVMSSHAVELDLNGNIAKFSFHNINLPDSGSNLAASNGFFTYSIRPKAGLNNGVAITNEAGIYFDFNDPVITNTTLNTIDQQLGTNDPVMTENHLRLYPNPAADVVTISLTRANGEHINIQDVLGNTVSQFTMSSDQADVNVSHFAPGVYFVSAGNTTNILKLVVTH